jgi:hypothetical protein
MELFSVAEAKTIVDLQDRVRKLRKPLVFDLPADKRQGGPGRLVMARASMLRDQCQVTEQLKSPGDAYDAVTGSFAELFHFTYERSAALLFVRANPRGGCFCRPIKGRRRKSGTFLSAAGVLDDGAGVQAVSFWLDTRSGTVARLGIEVFFGLTYFLRFPDVAAAVRDKVLNEGCALQRCNK